MRPGLWKHCVVVLACAAWAISVGTLAHLAKGVEEEGAAASSKQEGTSAKRRHRLPPYYARVVDDKQREAINAIQDEYAPRIEELQKQLEALIAERDAKIQAVLTPEQLEQVQQLAAKAKKQRKKRGSGESATADAPAEGDANANEDNAPAKNVPEPPTSEKTKGNKKSSKESGK